VAGVAADVDGILAVDSAGFVDVLDREVDASELRRAEERKIAGLRKQTADGQNAIALGCRRVIIIVVVVSATRSEHECPRCGNGSKTICPVTALHLSSG